MRQPCVTGEVRGADDICRLPANDGECMDVFGGAQPFYDSEEPDRCRPRSQDDCSPLILIDGVCAAPVSGTQCQSAGFVRMTLVQSGACAESCGAGSLPGEDGVCRPPQSQMECEQVFGTEPHLSESELRIWTIIDPDFTGPPTPCSPEEQLDCTVSGLVLSQDGSACVSPASFSQCIQTQFWLRPFNVIENGACAAACDAGRLPGAGMVCRDFAGAETTQCENGSYAAAGETCMQTCAQAQDGEGNRQIPESETCMKECADGRRISQREVCTKECADGGIIPEIYQCTMACPGGMRALEGETCERGPADPAELARNAAMHARLGVSYVHDRGYFGQGVPVAVVERGRVRETPDMEGRILSVATSEVFGIADGSGNSHPTGVANVLAASRNSAWLIGVAPEARIINPGNWLGTHPVQGFEEFSESYETDFMKRAGEFASYMARRGIPIINNSYSLARAHYGASVYIGELEGFGRARDARITEELETSAVPADIRAMHRPFFERLGMAMSDGLGESDSVFVWSTGNDGISPYGGIDIRSDTDSNLVTIVEISEFYEKFTDDFYGRLATLSLGTMPSAISQLPAVREDLEGNWLAVAALEAGALSIADPLTDPSRGTLATSLQLADFSNGCGFTKMWCLSAEGRGVNTGLEEDGSVETSNGTSFSSPIVAGALAVLKSAAPEMRMDVIRAILLSSATDIGEPGVDDIFGWGYVNVSAALVMMDGMQMESMGGRFVGTRYADLRGSLPAGLGHLRGDLKKVEVAIRITDDLYANIPLSELVSAQPAPATEIGGAAAKMSASPYSAPVRGFTTFGDSGAGRYGLRWHGAMGASDMFAELVRDENDAFLSSGFGALGSARAESVGGKMRLNRPLFGGLRAFGEYDYRAIRAETEGGFIEAIRGARAEGGEAGLSYSGLFGTRDKVAFSARRAPTLSGGHALLRYPHAEGDVTQALHGEKQNLVALESRLPLRRRPPTVWTLGYARPWGRGSEWSAAAEYEDSTGRGALSAEWRMDF